MDQSRMIEEITKEMNLTGAKGEQLPYPVDGPALSKADNATEDQKAECGKYPYRRIVGQLMYGMVHTMVCIVYALNVLSRYCNNPGPRHIQFLKHLLKYVKHARNDHLKFHTYDGPTDMLSMTRELQLHFQCDADLGGNLDNQHSTVHTVESGNDQNLPMMSITRMTSNLLMVMVRTKLTITRFRVHETTNLVRETPRALEY